MTDRNLAKDLRALARLRAAEFTMRPWGRELCYTKDLGAAGRVFEVRAGHALSLKQDTHRADTVYLLSGLVWFHLNGHEFEFIPGACLTIVPEDVHELRALEDSVLLSVSVPANGGNGATP